MTPPPGTVGTIYKIWGCPKCRTQGRQGNKCPDGCIRYRNRLQQMNDLAPAQEPMMCVELEVVSKNEVEIGWLAGIIEGEGHMGVVQRKERSTLKPNFSVCSTDREILEKIQTITGLGSILNDNGNLLGKKQIYRWQITKLADIQMVINWIYPHLGKRRQEQADKVLALPIRQRGRPKSK